MIPPTRSHKEQIDCEQFQSNLSVCKIEFFKL